MTSIAIRSTGHPVQRVLRHPVRVMRTAVRWDLSDAIAGWVAEEAGAFTPAADFRATEGVFVLRLDVPGVRASDLDIKLHHRRLIVSGVRLADPATLGETRYASERVSGGFVREFGLPAEVDPKSASADLDSGVLVVILRKKRTEKGNGHGPDERKIRAATRPRGARPRT